MSKLENAGPPTVTVTVFVPNSLEGKQFTWPQNMKVGDAADHGG
jgi:hypothetical protein